MEYSRIEYLRSHNREKAIQEALKTTYHPCLAYVISTNGGTDQGA
jgi:hypothetical protein